jgi:hypothetical protein
MLLRPLAPARDDWRSINRLIEDRDFARGQSIAAFHNLMPLMRRPDESGHLLRVRVKQVFKDYLRCRTVTGLPTDVGGVLEGTDDIWVAKMPDLRHSLTGQTIEKAITYGSYAIVQGRCYRIAHDVTEADPDQPEMVVPIWILGTETYSGPDTEIFVQQPFGGTGVTGDGAYGGCPVGTPIHWLLKDDRCWMEIDEYPDLAGTGTHPTADSTAVTADSTTETADQD